jgi:oligopeptidase B
LPATLLQPRLEHKDAIALRLKEPYLMKSTLCLLLASLMTTTATAATPPVPPDAAKHPHVVKAPFGATRNDDYYWLRVDFMR